MSAEDRAAGSSGAANGAAGHTPDTVHTPGTVQNRPQSMVMLATAMLIFGTIGIFRRYIPLSSGLLSFVRGVIGTAFLCLYVKLRGDRISHGLSRREIILLIVSGGLIGVNWILLFEAYNYTTVATATLCYYMEPTIVVLLSPVFFREKLTARKLICAAVAIVGMILVSGVIGQGPAQGNQLRGVIYGLSAAVLYAAVVILNKWLRSINAYEKTIIQLGAAALCLLPYLALTGQFSGVQLTPLSAVLTLILGLVHTGIAYTLYFGSTDGLKAQTIAVFSYIDPVSALIFAALILREPMSLTACIGAILILGAAFVSEM